MSARTWVQLTDWPLKLLNEGYDVWIGNNSDVDESHHAGLFWEQDWKNLNWGAFGMKDLPSEIDVVLEVTGAEKLTYIGHSQGTAQMFYGMSQLTDYYSKRIERFVALAPCVFGKYGPYDSYEN